MSLFVCPHCDRIRRVRVMVAIVIVVVSAWIAAVKLGGCTAHEDPHGQEAPPA